MLNSGLYKFEHGAMSIIQMGEELIGHPSTAISELIKNGYDADAFDYWVYINYSVKSQESFIVAYDNGLGMDETVLFGNWLHPSISSKRTGTGKSPVLNRSFLGSKGIGRLAAMALGENLTVVTKTADENKYSWLAIDREKFRKDTLLSDVAFPGGRADSTEEVFDNPNVEEYKGGKTSIKLIKLLSTYPFNNFKEGTLIVIERLDNSVKSIIEKDFKNEDVGIDDLAFLRSLKVLITPLSLNKKIQDELVAKNILTDDSRVDIANAESVFKAHFGINLLKENKFYDVEEVEILKHYDYRIIGKVDDEANVTAYFHCQRVLDDVINEDIVMDKSYVLSDEGLRSRKVKELEHIPADKKSSKIGTFFFDIRIYDRDPDCFEKLSVLFNTRNKNEAAKLLDKFLGLRISKNGFNIKPYGEEDKDWMEMGQMRVQNPTEVVGTNQILGNIFLFAKNDGLKEKTNREGFFENEAFINFKLILRAILLDLGKKRYKYRVKHNLGRTISNKFLRPDSLKFLNFLKNNNADEILIRKAEEFIDQTNTTFENFENSLSLSERLAALGSGLELVYHELVQPLTSMGSAWYSLMEITDKVIENEIRMEIITNASTIKNGLKTLTELQESLEPAIGKSKPHKFLPIDTFNKVVSLLRYELRENKIKVEVDNNLKKISFNSFEYVFWISFMNILNNAVYWLKKVDTRVIYIRRINEDTLEVSNTSPKINTGDLEAIFEYGVTMKQEKNATGLGLAYTKNMLSKTGFTIWCENKEYGPAFFIKKQK